MLLNSAKKRGGNRLLCLNASYAPAMEFGSCIAKQRLCNDMYINLFITKLQITAEFSNTTQSRGNRETSSLIEKEFCSNQANSTVEMKLTENRSESNCPLFRWNFTPGSTCLLFTLIPFQSLVAPVFFLFSCSRNLQPEINCCSKPHLTTTINLRL